VSEPTLGTELRPLLLAALLLRRWHWTILFPLVAAVLTAVVVLVLPSRYTSETTFTAQARPEVQLPSGITSLAGQLGLPLGTGGATSPKFYSDLVRSRAVLSAVLARRIGGDSAVPSGPRLLEWIRQGGRDAADSLDEGIRFMLRRVSSDVDRETGVVTVDVTVRDPQVAAAIARALLAEVDRFNTERRRSQARQRRIFIQQRIAESDVDVRQAEDDLENFYKTNRLYRESPVLGIEEQRLQARVTLQRELALTLRREYETARIEEVNDTPVLTVVDPPSVPVRRSFPKRKLDVLVALLASLVLGSGIAVAIEYVTGPATADAQGHDAYRAAYRDAVDGMRRLLRLQRRHPDRLR